VVYQNPHDAAIENGAERATASAVASLDVLHASAAYEKSDRREAGYLKVALEVAVR
jgi:hypothetical protein